MAKTFKIHSMTAFARSQHEAPTAEFAWELRSVNHRYLETSFKLPEPCRFLEMDLRDCLRSKLARGKIDVHLQFAFKSANEAMEVNQARISELMAALAQVESVANISSQPSSMQILNWPGVLEKQEFDMDSLKEELLASFNQAVDQLIQLRASEGEKLAVMVIERIALIRALVDKIEVLIPEILKSQHQRLSARLAELHLDIDAERMAQEAVLYAQKTDVAEEIDRLRAHLTEVESSLCSGKPCGRRLDFLMQELNREANTLASKSVHVDTSQGAVDLKVLIEQIREQVQNIE